MAVKKTMTRAICSRQKGSLKKESLKSRRHLGKQVHHMTDLSQNRRLNQLVQMQKLNPLKKKLLPRRQKGSLNRVRIW